MHRMNSSGLLPIARGSRVIAADPITSASLRKLYRPIGGLGLATLCVGVLSNPAHAQTTVQTVYVYAAAQADQLPLASHKLYNSDVLRGVLALEDASTGDSASAVTDMGVAHVIADASSTVDGNTSTGSGIGANAFGDVVYVSDPNEDESAMIAATVTIRLTGTLSGLAPEIPDPITPYFDQAEIDAGASWYSITGPATAPTSVSLLSKNAYTETETFSPDIPGAGSDVVTGSLTFTTMLQNDTDYFYQGTLTATVQSYQGGSAGAFFQDTALFGVTSTDTDATFIGAVGTNYSALTENGTGAAAAPEPSAVALLLPVVSGLGLAAIRRRRHIESRDV